MRVVIAEDLALLRDGLIRIFDAYGFEVVEAVDNGPSLVRALSTHRPDGAVVNARLPPTFTDEGLRAALDVRAQIPYRLTVCGLTGQVATADGLTVAVDGGLAQVRAADTVLVPGLDMSLRPLPGAVLDTLAEARPGAAGRVHLQRRVRSSRGRRAGRAPRHHALGNIDELEREFPAVHVDRDVLYVDEGKVLTSGGVCCGIDLCLHIVRTDVGAAAANQIARRLAAPPHRDGGQAQYVPALVPATGDTSLAGTRAWALERVEQPLSLAELARHAGMSQRSFMRRFTAETGTTPLRWLATARVTRARELLETTEIPVDQVARDCGLGTAANLRLHFRRTLATTPTAYRYTFTRRSSPHTRLAANGQLAG